MPAVDRPYLADPVTGLGYEDCSTPTLDVSRDTLAAQRSVQLEGEQVQPGRCASHQAARGGELAAGGGATTVCRLRCACSSFAVLPDSLPPPAVPRSTPARSWRQYRFEVGENDTEVVVNLQVGRLRSRDVFAENAALVWCLEGARSFAARPGTPGQWRLFAAQNQAGIASGDSSGRTWRALNDCGGIGVCGLQVQDTNTTGWVDLFLKPEQPAGEGRGARGEEGSAR